MSRVGARRRGRHRARVFGSFTLSLAGEPRRVRTFVPPRIDARPPVLVLFDGQNVLDDQGSFAGGWHAHRAIEKLAKTVRRPVLVAIDHGGHRRIRELWEELDPLLHFVVREAIPAAQDHVHLAFDEGAAVIGGASMGGLASLAALARHPHVFRGAMAMSPSAWVAPHHIGPELSRARFAPSSRVYVDVGLRESERMVREARRAAEIVARRLPASHRMWRPDRRGKHDEKSWRRRLPRALWFLLRR